VDSEGKNKMKIGLALGSGGAKGIAHIAFLEVLDELNIKPSIIAGTSAGAYIGAMYASGMSAKQIKEKFLSLSRVDMAKLTDFSFKSGLLKGEKIMKFLKSNIKIDNIEQLKIPMKIVAVDFWNKKQVVFNKGSITDAVRASISIPGVFEPKEIEGNYYVDGGVLNPVPFDIIRDDCDFLIAIDVFDYKKRKHGVRPSFFETIELTVQLMYSFIEKSRTTKPDILIKLSLDDYSILNFYKAKKIFSEIKNDVDKFKTEMEKFKSNNNLQG
jgi:NTE family protein